jgi:hypothetical protein
MEGCYHLVDSSPGEKKAIGAGSLAERGKAAAGTAELIWAGSRRGLHGLRARGSIESSTTLDMPAAAPKRLTHEAEPASKRKAYG